MDSNINTPSWLNQDYLTNLIAADDNSKQINQLKYEVSPAVGKGNNYSSVILRVKIKYEENGKVMKKSLIFKTELTSNSELLKEIGIVDKEKFFYTKVGPIMNKLIGFNLTPKYFPSKEAIILEDLREEGYVMIERLNRLDFGHCSAFMKAIGKFHASSFYMKKINPELFEDNNINQEIVFSSEPHVEIKEFLYNSLRCFQSALEEWQGYEHFAKFIEDNMHKLRDKMVEIFQKKKHISLLNHGDAWSTNMLFRHDDAGEVVDVSLIDLQTYRVVSPAFDLIVFLLTSAQEEVKEHRLSELYDIYLHSFNSLLKNISCDFVFTLEHLHDELEYCNCVYFCFLPWHVALSQCEKDVVLDTSCVFDAVKGTEDEGKKICTKLFQGEHFKKVAKYTLKQLEKQDFFSKF